MYSFKSSYPSPGGVATRVPHPHVKICPVRPGAKIPFHYWWGRCRRAGREYSLALLVGSVPQSWARIFPCIIGGVGAAELDVKIPLHYWWGRCSSAGREYSHALLVGRCLRAGREDSHVLLVGSEPQSWARRFPCIIGGFGAAELGAKSLVRNKTSAVTKRLRNIRC